jgi:hypothetical protein
LTQIGAIVIGVLVLFSGAFVALSRPISPKPYGISITTPGNNESVGITRVEGTIRKLPPSKYELWLLRIYRDGDFNPLQRIEIVRGREKWLVDNLDIGGNSGDRRTIGAFLINPAGQVLLEYFLAAARQHNRWMDNLNVPRENSDRWLPNLKRDMIAKVEMIECDRVDLIRR